MKLGYQVYDTQALAFVGEPFDSFHDAYLASATTPSSQVVTVEVKKPKK
jgi:hypothetical protein